eukprot:scaffold74307_cov51-Attheya_sp.AAC.3
MSLPLLDDFYMCSEWEAKDRQKHMELSRLECTRETSSSHVRSRKVDPRRVVKKYRRSAAGGGATVPDGGNTPRSVAQLDVTVHYLLGQVLTTAPFDADCRHSLAQVAAFVDDRLRAVQVDLTVQTPTMEASNNSKHLILVQRMEARMARYGLLVTYLLSNLDNRSKYEHAFGQTALDVAIDACLQWSILACRTVVDDDENNPIHILDEILSYAALRHVAGIITSRETALPPSFSSGSSNKGGGYSSLLILYQTHCMSHTADQPKNTPPGLVAEETHETFPKFKFALQLAALADGGNYNGLLKQLSLPSSSQVKTKDQDDVMWKTRCRLCLAPALTAIRIGAVRQYNKSFGKLEKVPASNMARLLYLPTPLSAIDFCKSIGLPTTEDDGFIIMKAAPINIVDSATLSKQGDHAFVFGILSSQWLQPNSIHDTETPKSNPRESHDGTNSDDDADDDDWEAKDEKDGFALPDVEIESSQNVASTDEDGVWIPPQNVIWSLIQ